jgi:hypothetical protein
MGPRKKSAAYKCFQASYVVERTFRILNTKAVGSRNRSSNFQKFPGAGAGAAIFKNFQEQERFGSIFYIIHNIYIYIDAYILKKKTCRMSNQLQKNMKT